MTSPVAVYGDDLREEVAFLRAELASVTAERDALEREVARLEAAKRWQHRTIEGYVSGTGGP